MPGAVTPAVRAARECVDALDDVVLHLEAGDESRELGVRCAALRQRITRLAVTEHRRLWGVAPEAS